MLTSHCWPCNGPPRKRSVQTSDYCPTSFFVVKSVKFSYFHQETLAFLVESNRNFFESIFLGTTAGSIITGRVDSSHPCRPFSGCQPTQRRGIHFPREVRNLCGWVKPSGHLGKEPGKLRYCNWRWTPKNYLKDLKVFVTSIASFTTYQSHWYFWGFHGNL